jgi:hypothetical protein
VDVRDLAYDERWRESLERSRARRGKTMPVLDVKGGRPTRAANARATRPAGHDDSARSVRRAFARRPIALLASPAGILACALLAALLPAAFGGTGGSAARRVGDRMRAGASPARHQGPVPVDYRSAGAAAPGGCEAVSSADGYVNPLAHASLKAKRIDQGVDYAGSGTLVALGSGIVTLISTADTGWPGAFIEYRLLDGPAIGCYVFYAEGLTPMRGLTVGQTLRAGQPVAAIIPGDPSGIEVGWGAGSGTETYAAKLGEWSSAADNDSTPTAAGMSFSSLIQALGGPPGRVMG